MKIKINTLFSTCRGSSKTNISWKRLRLVLVKTETLTTLQAHHTSAFCTCVQVLQVWQWTRDIKRVSFVIKLICIKPLSLLYKQYADVSIFHRSQPKITFILCDCMLMILCFLFLTLHQFYKLNFVQKVFLFSECQNNKLNKNMMLKPVLKLNI